MGKIINFTHYWVKGFGFETTIFLPSDFKEVEYAGKTARNMDIWFCYNDEDKLHVLGGNFK